MVKAVENLLGADLPRHISQLFHPGTPSERSLECKEEIFLIICNRSMDHARLLWIDYEGNEVQYKILKPGAIITNIITFNTHPWMFRSCTSGDALGFKVKFSKKAPPNKAFISLQQPVYSLKERSLQVLRDTLIGQDIKNIELPLNLKKELQSKMRYKCECLYNRLYQCSICFPERVVEENI